MAVSSPSRRTAVVEDRQIAFDDAGEGTPAVVLIHGAFANRSHYAPQVEHLSKRHRVLALDLRGHGESDVPEGGFRLQDFAQDVIAVCEASGVTRAVICGHSFPVALKVAAARPDLVAGVVLLDGAILFPETIRTQALTSFVPALEGDAWADSLRAYFSRFFGPYDSPDFETRVMEEIGKAPKQMVAPLFRDIMSSDHAAMLSSVDCPLLFVHARVPADLERLRQLRPDVMIGSVVGSGHYLYHEVPDQVNAMLDRFLEIVARG